MYLKKKLPTYSKGLCSNRKKSLLMKESHIPASYDKRSLQQVMYCLVVVLLSSLDHIGWTGAKWKGAHPKNRPRWGQTTQQCTRHFRLNTYSLECKHNKHWISDIATEAKGLCSNRKKSLVLLSYIHTVSVGGQLPPSPPFIKVYLILLSYILLHTILSYLIILHTYYLIKVLLNKST